MQKDMWSPTGKPVAPLSLAELLRNRLDLVVRHPALNRIHPWLKPWLSAGGVKEISCINQRQFLK
jgi:hypothetical protein